MHRRLVFILLSLIATATADRALAQNPDPAKARARALAQAPPGWPEKLEFPEEPAVGAVATALPPPSIKEPFEIGEALYDPSRVDKAVVSLLALMDIGIVVDNGAEIRPATGRNTNGLRLTESEVRGLIELGERDAAAAQSGTDSPFTFADLHRAVSSLLPGFSIDRLAEAYSKAYATQPDALVAKVLMGQPIEPDTPLTRAQLWLLLVDGFAALDGAGGAARWGTADAVLPDLLSPNPRWSAGEWKEVIARLQLVTQSELLVVNSTGVAQEGVSGPGKTLNIEARFTTKARPIVSSITGRTLLTPRTGSLAGRPITWELPEDSVLLEHGTVLSPTGQPVPTGADGVARFSFQPQAGKSGGRGELVVEEGYVDASIPARDLVTSLYDVPQTLGDFLYGNSLARANVKVEVARARDARDRYCECL